MVKRAVLFVLLGAALACGSGCALNPPPSPEVAAALAADGATAALVTLNHAIQNSADTKLISVEMARKIRKPIRAALEEIAAATTGASTFAIATRALDEIEATVPANTKRAIQPFLTSTRAALGVNSER
jgi:hypothetical protein